MLMINKISVVAFRKNVNNLNDVMTMLVIKYLAFLHFSLTLLIIYNMNSNNTNYQMCVES